MIRDRRIGRTGLVIVTLFVSAVLLSSCSSGESGTIQPVPKQMKPGNRNKKDVTNPGHMQGE